MPSVEQQALELPRELIEVDPALIERLPNFTASLKLCKEISGHPNDKPIYMGLGIDAGQWTRIMSGQAHFPHEKLKKYMLEVCGNIAPLLYLAHSCGFDHRSIRRKQTAVEAENDALRAENEQLKRDMQVISEFLRKAGKA